jgi:hypothetical protein
VYILVWQQGVAVVLGEVVLVGDQHGGDGRVVLVGQASVLVHMGQVLLGEALHRLLILSFT